MFKIISTFCIIFLHNSLFSSSKTLIGDYHVGFDLVYSTSDFAEFGGISFDLTRPINNNFDLGVGGGIGSLSFQYTDIMQYDLSLGLRLHNKYEINNSVLNSVDPFLFVSSGVVMWQQFTWVYTGSDYSKDYYQLASTEEFAVPWIIALGAELKLGEKFSIVPSIASVGYFDLDVDSSIDYSLTGTIFINENWSATFRVGKNVDFDKMSYAVGFDVYY